MRTRLATAVVGVLAVTVALGACSKTEDTPGGPGAVKDDQTNGIATDPKDSQGPAAEIPGAKRGGTLYYLRNTSFPHLDPTRQYSVAAIAVGQLYSRTLTAFKEPGNNRLLLVGDLAETPGTDVNNDCKTWEFKIKKGVKYEDGREVTAGDIAYGISRGFNPDLVGGPVYLQTWLADSPNFTEKWDFKAKGQTEYAPGLEVPDDYTLRFNFAKPHCELPYALNLPSSAPLPRDRETGTAYDDKPFSSGPYKIQSFTKGSSLILERNPNWDAKTDPIRTAYPDLVHIKFSITSGTATNRMIADQGEDKNATVISVDPGLVPTIAANKALQDRVISEETPFQWYLFINNKRVKDLKVRQALNYGVDRDAYIKSVGGDLLGTPATTILSPLTVGWQNYDAYPAGATGNPDKAKELLAGQTPELVLAHGDEENAQKSAVVLKASLEKAGFKITLKAVTADDYLDLIGRSDNVWDLYVSGWACDWATAATTIPVLFDGRNINPENNTNYSYFTDKSVSDEVDRIDLIADPVKAAEAWAALDKRIMTEFAPVVPIYTDRDYVLHGSNVGGLFESDSIGTLSFVNAYLKS